MADRTRRRIDEMLESLVAAREFEDVLLPHEIGARVGRRILERVTHAGLGGEVQNHIELRAGRRRSKRVRIGDIALGKSIDGLSRQLRQARVLERRGVVRIEIVDRHDFVAARQERLARMEADKSRAAGEEYTHGRCP